MNYIDCETCTTANDPTCGVTAITCHVSWLTLFLVSLYYYFFPGRFENSPGKNGAIFFKKTNKKKKQKKKNKKKKQKIKIKKKNIFF